MQISSNPQYKITKSIEINKQKLQYISAEIRNTATPIKKKTDYNELQDTLISMY